MKKLLSVPKGKVLNVSTQQKIEFKSSKYYDLIMTVSNGVRKEHHYWVDGAYDGNSIEFN